jgi:hypothetical protein
MDCTCETPVAEPAGRVQLGLDRHTYPSPKAADRAVVEQATGWADGDNATGLIAPHGLEKWKRPEPGPAEIVDPTAHEKAVH